MPPQGIFNPFLQQALGNAPNGVFLRGPAPLPGAAPQLTLPSATLASFAPHMPTFLGGAPGRAPPSAKEVQDALATIAAATAPMANRAALAAPVEPTKRTPAGGHPRF